MVINRRKIGVVCTEKPAREVDATKSTQKPARAIDAAKSTRRAENFFCLTPKPLALNLPVMYNKYS